MRYYKHYKGGFYKLITSDSRVVSRNSDYITPYVVYKALQGKGDFKKGQIFHRNTYEFHDSSKFREMTLFEVCLLFVGLRKFIFFQNNEQHMNIQ